MSVCKLCVSVASSSVHTTDPIFDQIYIKRVFWVNMWERETAWNKFETHILFGQKYQNQGFNILQKIITPNHYSYSY